MDIVSFVILHYKDLEATALCVQSILRMDHRERIRVVIVDNDVKETPDFRSRLWERYKDIPEVTVIPVMEDGGFSYANNLGYAYAREKQKASFILVLNNDIEFIQRDFLERLYRVYRAYPCAVLGPDIIRRSTGEHQNPLDLDIRAEREAEYTRRMNLWALRHYDSLYPILYWKNKFDEKKKCRARRKNAAYYQAPREDIVPFGAVLIFAPDFVGQESRAFWPETHFYYEEYILACRCRKKGYSVLYTPELTVMHESGVATKKTYGREKERMRFVMEQVAAACGVYLDYLRTHAKDQGGR